MYKYKLKIQIGDFESYYQPIVTTAPIEFDGFGTISITNFSGRRLVMIRDQHFEWQTLRYQSGGHSIQDECHIPSDRMAQMLRDRLLIIPEKKPSAIEAEPLLQPYQIGSFIEFFGPDALRISDLYKVPSTKLIRPSDKAEIDVCGIPDHSFDRLVVQMYRIGIIFAPLRHGLPDDMKAGIEPEAIKEKLIIGRDKANLAEAVRNRRP